MKLSSMFQIAGRLTLVGYFLVGIVGVHPPTFAHEVLALSASNIHWHAPDKSITVTFLGNDEKQKATLSLKKVAVLDTEISIQADATTITLVSGDSTRISFKVQPNPDGTTSRLNFGGGDQPVLKFNGKEDPRLRGKWIEVVTSKEKNLTIELENTTFATVKFDPKSLDQGGASAPATPSVPLLPDGAVSTSATDSATSHELLQNVSPTELEASAKSMGTAVDHRCARCNGKGNITENVQYGTRQEGIFIKKLYHDETHTCKTCGGSGHLRANDDLLKHSAATFVRNLARMKRDDPHTQEANDAAYKMITNVMIGDYRTWMLFNENGRSILSQSSPVIGTPVIVRVNVIRKLPGEGEKREFLAKVVGIDKEVRILSPKIADDIDSGTALVGGLVAAGDKSGSTTVLEHGFLVAPPIDHVWWWWYGERPRP